MKKILIQLLLVLWQFPQFLVGGALLLFYKIFGGIKFFKYEDYVWFYEADRIPGAISLGPIIITCTTRAEYQIHEWSHSHFQSRKLGPMYLFIIGLFSILWASMGGARNYYSYWTEHLWFPGKFNWKNGEPEDIDSWSTDFNNWKNI